MHLFIPDDPRPLHFMGIAGAGMSALALVARSRGVAVTGCDTNPSGALDLGLADVPVLQGHSADHVNDVRAVVYTSAVPREHAELEAALAAGIPVVRRAEALQEAVRGGRTVAIAGTHGKTTTTVMAAVALEAAGADPTTIVGGRVAEWGGNARIGSDDLFVVEADEYDRSFLALQPEIAVVANVEADHLECYESVRDLEAAFVEFATRANRVLIGADDPGAMRVARAANADVWRVGTASEADLRLSDIRRHTRGTAASLSLPDGRSLDLELRVPGVHNLRNAALAVGTVLALECDVERSLDGLRQFAGVARRFEVLGMIKGITVVDDYAHHATEVAVTLDAARQRFPESRLLAVFQPHLFTRTQRQGEAIGLVLAAADHVVVTEIYPAREQPIEGVTGKIVVDAARAAGARVDWVPDRAELPGALAALARDGDVVLTLGAGDITEVGPALLRRLAGAAA